MNAIDSRTILTFVVVSVTVGVVAFPINPPVFFVAHVKALKKKKIRTLVNRCALGLFM